MSKQQAKKPAQLSLKEKREQKRSKAEESTVRSRKGS